jgi:hypothetical protein
MGLTYSDNNAYLNLGTVSATLDDAKAAYIAAQNEVDNATVIRNARKSDLDAAYAAYIPCLTQFDSLMSAPPPGYVATPPTTPPTTP